MRFCLPRTIDHLAGYFQPFLELAGGERWWKRAEHLFNEGQRSPYLAKIMADHHWLELELSAQIGIWRENDRLLPDEVLPQSMAALLFAGMVVETHERLGAAGRKNLLGRLRDGLKGDSAGLAIELDVALQLLDQGFDVEFPDLEGSAAYDIRFRNAATVGEVECKSISADAGRKIHRKDFYRLMDALGPSIAEYANKKSPAFLIISLEDRLLPDTKSQHALVAAASRVLSAPEAFRLEGPDFEVKREPYDGQLGHANLANSGELYAGCSKAFGANCHVAGLMTELGGCLVVVRSRREDDHSLPQLEALKKAASQLSGDHPGFIAVQFEDIEPPDLTLPHVRRRSALLANVVFHAERTSHLAAVYHTAYGGLHAAEGVLSKPAFVCWNPRWHGSSDGLPFATGITNSEFARRLGIDPATTDPDDYSYGREV